jgi:hypothetical protein
MKLNQFETIVFDKLNNETLHLKLILNALTRLEKIKLDSFESSSHKLIIESLIDSNNDSPLIVNKLKLDIWLELIDDNKNSYSNIEPFFTVNTELLIGELSKKLNKCKSKSLILSLFNNYLNAMTNKNSSYEPFIDPMFTSIIHFGLIMNFIYKISPDLFSEQSDTEIADDKQQQANSFLIDLVMSHVKQNDVVMLDQIVLNDLINNYLKANDLDFSEKLSKLIVDN